MRKRLGVWTFLPCLGTALASWDGDATLDIPVTQDPVNAMPSPYESESLIPPLVQGNVGGAVMAVPTPFLTGQGLNAQGDLLWSQTGVRSSQLLAGLPGGVTGAPDGRGGMISAWSVSYPGGQGFDLYVQRFDAGGAPLWGDGGVRLSGAAGDQIRPLAVADGVGGAVIAWEDPRNLGDLYAQRVDALGHPLWTGVDGIPVVSLPNPQRLRALVPLGAGEAVLVWSQFTGSNDPFWAQRLDGRGGTRWVRPLSDGSEGQVPLSAIPDGLGGVIVCRDSQAGLMAQRLDPDGNPLWPGGVRVTGNLILAQDMASDGAGGAIMTWLKVIGFDVFAQRVDAGGALRWVATGVPVCRLPSDQDLPKVVSAGDGGAVIGWEDERAGPLHSVFAQRLDPDGRPLWAPNGVLMTQTDQPLLWGKVAEDGEGGLIGSYLKGAAVPFFAFANHLSPSGERGVPGWYRRYGSGSGLIPSRIRVAGIARSGQDFPLSATGAEPRVPGWLILGARQDMAGTVVRGARIHVDLTHPYRVIPVVSNEAGGNVTSVPLPAGTAGRTWYAQYVWNGSYRSASDALAITIQP